MANGRIRIIGAIPGSTSLVPIVRDFTSRREGVVTAFSDALLPICSQLVGEDSLIEVKPFGELVRQTLEMCGEEVCPIAQQAQCVAATAQVIADVDRESPFYATRAFNGLHERIWRTLTELRKWEIDQEEMIRLLPLVTDRLGRKLDDLAQLSSQVDEILNSVGRQTHEQHLRASLQSSLERDGSLERLLVFAGSDDSPLRARWLNWIADNGTEVMVVIDRHASGGALFESANKLAKHLNGDSVRAGDANRLARNLFVDPIFGGPPIEAKVVSAADPLAEVEWALRGCLSAGQLHESAIFVRSLEAYAPLLESASLRLGVPLRMARRAPLLTNAFARLTLTAVRFCASNDVRMLAPIVRSSYLGLSAIERAEFESQVKEAHRTKSKQWNTLLKWSEDRQEQFPWLQKLLLWRLEALESDASLAEWTQRLRALIGVLPWHDNLGAVPGYASDRDQRAQTQLQRVLASYATVEQAAQPRPLSLSRFAEFAAHLWEAADVSMPTNEYGVTVSSNAESLGQVENLTVLGMLEGVFPRRRTEDPILTDDERNEISRLRPGFAPLRTSFDEAQAERDEFYRVCATPRRSIAFSYPLADDEKDNIPAYYLEKVREALGSVSERDHPRTMLAPRVEDCVSSADRDLRASLDGPREKPLPLELLSDVALDALKVGESHRFEPGELRDALICPFMEVSRHRLALRPNRRGVRWYSLSKLPQVATLPLQGGADQASSALLDALDAELDKLYGEIPEWESQLMLSGGRRQIQDWVRRELIARELWPKDAGSTLMNVGFGDHGLRAEMPGQVALRGIVPAISRIGATSVVHLYRGAVYDLKNITDAELLFLGLHFLAISQPGREAALEIEGSGSKRSLYLLSRSNSRSLPSRTQDGLEVKELCDSDDPVVAKRLFYDRVKTALRSAVQRVRGGTITATKGEHCSRCDYGELCRRSQFFGEDDSPFGIDLDE